MRRESTLERAEAPLVAPSVGGFVEPRGAARIASIDILRGLVMIIMALDHTRDFFSTSGFNPHKERASEI